MKRKLEKLLAQKMSGGRQRRERVDCLHCGHSFLTKESLWDHMVAARQRLTRQSASNNSTSEWMYAISTLLEPQSTDNPTPMDTSKESVATVGKRRSSYSEVIPHYHPSEGESGVTEEDWYLSTSGEWRQSKVTNIPY